VDRAEAVADEIDHALASEQLSVIHLQPLDGTHILVDAGIMPFQVSYQGVSAGLAVGGV
jgi:hypothetical protein